MKRTMSGAVRAIVTIVACLPLGTCGAEEAGHLGAAPEKFEKLKARFEEFCASVARDTELPEGIDFFAELNAGLAIVRKLEKEGKHKEAVEYAHRMCKVTDTFAAQLGKGHRGPPPFVVCRMALEHVGELETALAYELRNVRWREANRTYVTYYDLGRIAWKSGKVEESVQWFEKEIVHDPENLLAYGGLATALVKGKGEKEKAAALLRSAIEVGLRVIESYSEKQFRYVCLAPPGSRFRDDRMPVASMTITVPSSAKEWIERKLADGYIDVTPRVRKARIDAARKILELYLNRYATLVSK